MFFPSFILSLSLGFLVLGPNLGSDAVQVALSLRAHPASAVGVLLHPLELLQRLQGLSGHGAAASAPVGGHAAVIAANCK